MLFTVLEVDNLIESRSSIDWLHFAKKIPLKLFIFEINLGDEKFA